MNERDDDLEEFGLDGAARGPAPAAKPPAADSSINDVFDAADILGALASTNIKSSSAFQQALAKKLANRSPIVQKIQPTKKRRYTMGFGPTTVPPHSSVTVQAQPRVLFRAEKLINTGDTTDVVIDSMFVGNKSQFPLPPHATSIPVSHFGATTLDSELLFDVCEPAMFMTIGVRNVGGTTATFAFAMIGHIVQ